MSEKRISSKDVAKAAGVSQATVSYVLNNTEGVCIRPETREVVLDAARKLNYHPNIVAKSMKMNKVYSIGVVSDKSMSSNIFMSVMEGIKDYLSKQNYSLTICSNQYDNFASAEFIKYYKSKRIDGIIFAYTTLVNEQIQFLTDENIPFSIVRHVFNEDSSHVVKTSLVGAMEEAILYLREQTGSDIGYIGSHCGDLDFSRFSAFHKAHCIHKLSVNENLLYTPVYENDLPEMWLRKRFPGGFGLPAALICENTTLAYYLMRHCAESGIDLPSDLRIVGIGNSQFADYSFPSLSTLEAPLFQMGVKAAAMLLHLIDHENFEDMVVLEWSFIHRGSS